MSSTRYITRGIQENISPYIQRLLWGMVERRDKAYRERHQDHADYFSIFHLKDMDGHLTVTFLQEQPPYSEKIKIKTIESFQKEKVYVVREDDGDLPYYIMLLPEEY